MFFTLLPSQDMLELFICNCIMWSKDTENALNLIFHRMAVGYNYVAILAFGKKEKKTITTLKLVIMILGSSSIMDAAV